MKKNFTMAGAICPKCGYNNDFSAIKCPCGNRLRYSDQEIYESMSVGQKRVTKILDILESFWNSGYGFFPLIILHVIFLWSMLSYFDTVPLSIIAIEQIILSIVVTLLLKLFNDVPESFFHFMAALFTGLTLFGLVIAFVYAWYKS